MVVVVAVRIGEISHGEMEGCGFVIHETLFNE